ncbi:uncharacterized protein LOC122019407 [Zingiber officinale]|uniref:uncharacterized protein LOC122019407 n=1 Tax=Zingiber officinale TaxID=94328 RepID=UPI001C4AA7C5|nr:uncharacterized protein LOC122019407 [Zingiber officinale]
MARNSPCIEKEDLGEVIDQDREERLIELEAGEAGEKKEPDKKSARLPDCLLLMLYEPKLSMEVSKETWVCSNDFLHRRLRHPIYQPWHPSKPSAAVAMTATSAGSNNDKDEVENKEVVTSILPAIPHPPPPSRQPTPSTVPEKSRGNASAAMTPVPPSVYGPLALTRCESEQMRSSAKLTPDACFWKDRHRPIGAAGIGL